MEDMEEDFNFMVLEIVQNIEFMMTLQGTTIAPITKKLVATTSKAPSTTSSSSVQPSTYQTTTATSKPVN